MSFVNKDILLPKSGHWNNIPNIQMWGMMGDGLWKANVDFVMSLKKV
jgi:hypothetical protein